MGKAEARKRAEAGGYTLGDLKNIVEAAQGGEGRSTANPGLTKTQAKEILGAPFESRDLSEEVKPFRYNIRTGRNDKRTRDSLWAQNIFREFC